MDFFSDKVVLVSAAAGGIGKQVALTFAGSGAKIAAIDKNPHAINQLEKELDKISAAYITEVLDITSPAMMEKFVKKLADQFGRVDVLVNNVGIGLGKRFFATSPADFDLVLQTNFRGPFFLTQKAVQHMPKGGSIIFISSIHSQHPSLDPAYDASKAAIESLLRNLSLQLSPQEIRVNGVSPGHIDTKTASAPRSRSDVPLFKKAGLPEDIAQACLFLADNRKSGYITGTILEVGGGLHLPIAQDLQS